MEKEQIFSWAGTARSAKLLFGQPTRQEHNQAMNEMAVWEAEETLRKSKKTLAEKETEMWNKIFSPKEIHYSDDEPAEESVEVRRKWAETEK